MQELLGRMVDLEGFEIEMVMDLLKAEIARVDPSADPDYRQDLKDLLDKLAA